MRIMTKLLQLSCCWRSNQVGGKGLCRVSKQRKRRVSHITPRTVHGCFKSESLTTEYLWLPCAIQVFGVRSIVVANHNVVSHSCTWPVQVLWGRGVSRTSQSYIQGLKLDNCAALALTARMQRQLDRGHLSLTICFCSVHFASRLKDLPVPE